MHLTLLYLFALATGTLATIDDNPAPAQPKDAPEKPKKEAKIPKTRHEHPALVEIHFQKDGLFSVIGFDVRGDLKQGANKSHDEDTADTWETLLQDLDYGLKVNREPGIDPTKVRVFIRYHDATFKEINLKDQSNREIQKYLPKHIIHSDKIPQVKSKDEVKAKFGGKTKKESRSKFWYFGAPTIVIVAPEPEQGVERGQPQHKLVPMYMKHVPGVHEHLEIPMHDDMP